LRLTLDTEALKYRGGGWSQFWYDGSWVRPWTKIKIKWTTHQTR